MKVAIIGFGLIGGSIALNLKLVNPSVEIVGVDPDESSLEYGVTHGFCDVPRGTLTDDVAGSDYVILAVHLGVMEEVASSLTSVLSGGELVMDVSSVKGWVVDHVKPIFDRWGVSFAACHPIAGTEKRGAMNAVRGLFDKARCIITPSGNRDVEIARARIFWELLGSRVEVMDPYLHDRIFAQVSHLPHLVAYALVDYLLDEDEGAALDFAGGGFRDFTRIAASSPEMWVEIFKRNREFLLDALEGLTEKLSHYRSLIERECWDELYDALDSVSRVRGRMKF